MRIAQLRSAMEGVWPAWLHIPAILILLRAVLILPAMIGASFFPIKEGARLVINPGILPQLWERWDSGYYLKIAQYGYSFKGTEVGFMPAYPLLMRLFGQVTLIPVTWTGVVIANVSFVFAGVVFWRLCCLDSDPNVAQTAMLMLAVFPTAFFFSAIYTESFFLLLSVMVYWCSTRQNYELAAVFVALASLTHMNGIALITIPLAELLLIRPTHLVRRIIQTSGISVVGLAVFAVYIWQTQGSFLVFLSTQQTEWKRSLSLPWRTIWDSLSVVVVGSGGFAHNWFMRLVSLQDLLATALFLLLAIVAFRSLRKSLAAYMAASLLVLTISHGPYTLGLYSMSRYVLVLFPGFVVLGQWLEHKPQWKWFVLGSSLLLQCLLTAWFAHGGWVA